MAAPKGRGRALKRHGDASTVSVKVDAKRKERFDKLRAAMQSSHLHEASGFDAYWEAVAEIIDHELYIAGGHETIEDFLRAEVKVPKRTATRLMRVARYASPVEEAKYGTAVLDAALTYIEAITGGPIQGRLPVAFEKLRIPVEREGKTTKVSLTDATLREITAATQALLSKGSSAKKSERPPAEKAFAAALKNEKALAGVTVIVRDGTVKFSAVPFEAVKLFIRALASVKLDADHAVKQVKQVATAKPKTSKPKTGEPKAAKPKAAKPKAARPTKKP